MGSGRFIIIILSLLLLCLNRKGKFGGETGGIDEEDVKEILKAKGFTMRLINLMGN